MGFFKLLYAILLTIAPISELRIGLPVAITYAIENNIPLLLIFTMILLVNLITVFFIFLFLDFFHSIFMNWKFYRKGFNWYIKRFQNKIKRFNKKYDKLGFLALVFLVAIPLPGTGAWTGSILSWALKLDRKKSILAICMGVIIAGLLVFLGTLGFINIFQK